MIIQESPIETIFSAALATRSPEDRAAYLNLACGGDPELRCRVEQLLEVHPQLGSFLERDAPELLAATTVLEPPALESPGTVIGPYKLIEQIGEGGMGTVWMAQQTEPVKRLVAVKLIKAGMDSRQVIARFEAECQALALMDHANIARVLDAGTTIGEPGGVNPGRPYFVMDLVKGVSITKYCDEHDLTPRQRLGLFIPVCQAIQHAHQKGIIHRDLKPSNVLVALYDGRPVPKVIDFGVAKAAGQSLTEKTLVTGFGAIVGTVEYMSPEQAELNPLDIDTRSDIYSLGVLLYELLWSQGVAFSPDGLRLASAGVDGTVRVWDATPLRGVEGQEVFTFSQHPTEVFTMAVSPDGGRIASAGLGVDNPVKVWDVKSRRENFEFRGHRLIVFSVAWHPDGQRIASSGWDAERKAFVVKDWDPRTGEVGVELSVGMETYAVAFSPDGEHLVTGSANGAVQIWRGRAGRVIGKLSTHGPPVRGLVFSRDGRRLASASGDGVVRVWDWHATGLGDDQKPHRTFRARAPFTAMTFAFSPDGKRLVAGGEEHTVRIWDLQSQQVQVLRGHSGDVWTTAFSPDPEGRWVASAGEDTTVKVWDIRSGELVHSFRGHTGIVSSVAFSPDGRQLFSGSRDKTVKVWNLTQQDQGPGR